MKTATKKTIVDKDFPDYTLHPYENGIRGGLEISSPLPNTYYRIHNKTEEVKCIVNILEDGWHIAWDTCSGCASYMTICKCSGGIKTTRSVVYFYYKARHEKLGEPMITTTELYKGVPPVARKSKPYIPPTTKITRTVVESVAPRQGEDTGMSIEDIEKIDLSTLDKTAKKMAKDGLRSIAYKRKKKG